MTSARRDASRRIAVLVFVAALSGTTLSWTILSAISGAAAQTTGASPPSAGAPATASPVTGVLQEETTVGNLLRACRAGVGNGLMYCYGYIGGVIDAHRRTVDAHPDAARFCAPRLKAEQRRRVFLEWALRATDSYGARALDGVELALIGKFPCPRPQTPRRGDP